MPKPPRVSVVIPSLTGRVEALQASIARQTLAPVEVHVIEGVTPSGRAAS